MTTLAILIVLTVILMLAFLSRRYATDIARSRAKADAINRARAMQREANARELEIQRVADAGVQRLMEATNAELNRTETYPYTYDGRS